MPLLSPRTLAWVAALGLLAPVGIARSAAAPRKDACTLTVAVAGPDGKPMPGVALTLHRQEKFVTLDTLTGRTGKDGKATFKTPPGFLRVFAQPSGFIPRARVERCPHYGGTPSTTLALKKAGPVKVYGTVTSDAGPPAGLEVTVVEILKDRDKKLFPYATPVRLDAKTGKYAFSVVPGRAYRLYANAPGYRFQGKDLNLDPSRPNLVTDVKVDARDIQFDLKLAREATLKGRVTLADGSHADRAHVFVGPMTAMGPILFQTNTKGGIDVAAVANKKLVVTARAGRFVGSVEVGPLAAGTTATITVPMVEGRVIRGRVIAATRVPDEKPTRVFYRARRIGLWGYIYLDAKGAFAVNGMPKGETVEFFIPQNANSALVNAVPGQNTVKVIYVPGRPGSVRVRFK